MAYNPAMAPDIIALDDEPTGALPVEGTRPALLTSEIDRVLTTQLVVGWAGEGGEEKRLGWWRSDLVSEFGGEDLARRLLPNTWRWAVLQAAREAARLADVERRHQAHDRDHIVSLFGFGFAVDERVDDRLQELKRSGRPPEVALPGLADGIEEEWSRGRFLDWIHGHGKTETTVTTIGRELRGAPDSRLEQQLKQLVAGLDPLGEHYPLPYFRRAS